MSFFYDILADLGAGELQDNLEINIVKNKGALICGNVKILNFSDEQVVINYQKENIEILGENLMIKTMSKGEILICGKIKNVKFGE